MAAGEYHSVEFSDQFDLLGVNFMSYGSRRNHDAAADLPTYGVFIVGGLCMLIAMIGAPLTYWTMFRIYVPAKQIAILTHKTGKDLPTTEEFAPGPEYKGVQMEVLGEGRHFRNPWNWDWEVVPQVEIPQGACGVRIRLYGDEPAYGQVVAWNENEKGIVPEVLRSSRYPINAKVIDCRTPERKEIYPRRRQNYTEIIEIHHPVTVPAGFVGVVTNLSSPLPEHPNTELSEPGRRGVQTKPLGPETHYVNPYVTRIDLVDCRSQRFNLAFDGDMGFPSKDGFWVSLDGIVEFRVKEQSAPRVFVLYNEFDNDKTVPRVDDEIINKIILPNARSFCRIRGSDHTGREFISGETRKQFQEDFQKEMERQCEKEGIEIVQALITKINPPQQIAEPVRKRQIAIEQRRQYSSELTQQDSEKKLATESEMNERKQTIVDAEKKVILLVTSAKQEQEVSLIKAEQRLKVAELELKAAEDLASAITSRGQADAKVVEYGNEAEAAGWKKSVQAYGGKGDDFARGVMLRKLAPAFRSMMVNTADSPIMDIFREYERTAPAADAAPSVTTPKSK